MSNCGDYSEPSPTKSFLKHRRPQRKRRPPSRLSQFSCDERMITFDDDDLVNVPISDSQGFPDINGVISGDWASISQEVAIDKVQPIGSSQHVDSSPLEFSFQFHDLAGAEYILEATEIPIIVEDRFLLVFCLHPFLYP